MRKLDNNEIKEIQLEILDSVHDFCIKNNINYSLYYGTLLGAFRHKGYIPWDDDIDIIMSRPDYTKFINSYKGKSYHILDNQYSNKDCVLPFSKIFDTRTSASGPNNIDDRHIFIDIFPLDGFPEVERIPNFLERINKIYSSIRKRGKYYKYSTNLKEKLTLIIKYLIKTLTIPPKDHLFKGLDKLLKTNKFETSDYVGIVYGEYGMKEVMPRELFSQYRLTPFENKEYMIISKGEEILNRIYGDWHKLPPIDQREGKHFYEVYLKE